MEISKTESWIMMKNDVKNCKGIYNFKFIINKKNWKMIQL